MSKTAKKSSIKELTQQIGELTEALQRERADALNLQRRTEEQRAQLADIQKATVVRELLPALDNLERALNHVPKNLASNDYVKGVKSLAKQFEQAFRHLGVQRLKTVGQPFDPRYHEAISIEDMGGGTEVVCEELQSGYRIGDEIIRHAMVKVKRS